MYGEWLRGWGVVASEAAMAVTLARTDYLLKAAYVSKGVVDMGTGDKSKQNAS